MCIAILNNRNTISKKTLKTCHQNNPDGMGMAWVQAGEIKYFKELDSFKVFYSKYRKVRESTRGPILLHFRISTGGLLDLNNCHPFKINKTCAFMHNGVIPDYSGYQDNFTDTVHFNAEVLQQFEDPFRAVQQPGIKRLIQDVIGYSKLVFLNHVGETFIINADLGHWIGENWYSNKSYLPKPKPIYKNYGWGKDYAGDYSPVGYIGSYKKEPKKAPSYWEAPEVPEALPEILDNCDACGKEAPEDEICYSNTYNAYLCRTCRLAFQAD